MINKFKGVLKSKKTYVTAVIGILTAIGAYLTGDLAGQDALKTIWVAVLAVFLRNGMKGTSEENK